MNLYRKMASGVVINLVFAVVTGLTTVGTILVMSRFLQPKEVGLFSLALAFVETFVILSDFGFREKFVQDAAEDTGEIYRLAFTINLIFAVLLVAVVLALAPLVARFYGEPVLWPLLSVMSYAAMTGVLTLPLALFYKELKFLQYRLFPMAGRVAGFIVVVWLAYAGKGVWALAFGGMATLFVTAMPLWLMAPVKHGLLLDIKRARHYISFSLPIWGSKLSGIATQQGAVFVISSVLSMRELGMFRLSEQVAAYAFLIEVIIGQTIFPALCRMQDSETELRNIFVTVCKVSMIWAAPIGMGLLVFADELVMYVFSSRWTGMELLLQIQGVAVLFGSVAYAWDNFIKARGSSTPTLTVAVVMMITFTVVFVPAIVFLRYKGIAIGIGAIVLTGLVLKQYYMGRLFSGISILRIVLPELVAAGVAGGGILLWKAGWGHDASVMLFVARLMSFLAGYLLLITLLEKKLIFSIPSFIVSIREKKAVDLETA